MASISETSSSAAYSAADTRSQLAANAIRDQNAEERQVASRLDEAQESEQTRREARKIPGLGEAVDISV
ncbi:hypothetical protein [Labrenzia sp. 011]|uniref:hypothetical protein n=1 Tax=Labrenzia sp. 011 TaxID=2171494 RepID=UPI000D51C94C|nr:hypothetical protein [Labrenzia sp. 011]PVB62060.1 hypothetical protein DCO57_09260 [Labrenzia sp. 011]